MVRLIELAGRRGDLLLAVALVLLGLVEIATDGSLSTGQALGGGAGLVGIGALLAVRRRLPLVILGVLLVSAIVEPWTGEAGDGEVFGLIVLLAVYTAAAHTERRRMWIAAALTFAMAWVVMINDPDGVNLGAMIFFGLLFGTPWGVGRAIRHRRQREAALEERAVTVEREQEERARAAVAEERARIARELHDVVAHAISVIVVQARGGRRLLEAEPDAARGAFDAIESTGQQALGEMRRLLGLLRTKDELLALAPQPTLTRLDALVAEVEKAGLPVELEVEGELPELPPGVDLSAYRIVQEALTNALKHAGPARARVFVRYEDDELELVVSDDGAGSGNGDGSGHGLIGIRERVAVLGGDLEAGPRSNGGYAVRARLPYSSAR